MAMGISVAKRIFHENLTSKKPIRIRDFSVFQGLVIYSAIQSAVIHTIETYELEGDAEIARIDLGQYGPENEKAAWEEKVYQSASDSLDLLRKVEQEGKEFLFEIWLEFKETH